MLDQFWNNVRAGADSLPPPSVVADSPHIDTTHAARVISSADLWLTPRVVEGFNAADFDFLSASDRRKLKSLVEDFRKIASKVPGNKPATTSQVKAARPLFEDIVKLMDFAHYSDPQALRTGKRLEQALKGRWPSGLVELKFRTGKDNTGDPGLWIDTILKDEAAHKENFLSIYELLHDEAMRIDPVHWAFVRFRTVSEQAELELEGSAT